MNTPGRPPNYPTCQATIILRHQPAANADVDDRGPTAAVPGSAESYLRVGNGHSFIQMLGSVGLVMSMGIQWMLAALMAWGPNPLTPDEADKLTSYGRIIVRPERDISIYIMGVVVTTFAMVGMVWLRRRRNRSLDTPVVGSLFRAGLEQFSVW